MSLQSEIIKFVMKYRRKAMEKQEFDILGIRQYMDDLFEKTFITPWTVTVNPISLKGIAAEVISPAELAVDDAIIIYVHGGGYFMGKISTHRPLAAWVVHESGLPAVIFDYALAPERPFPVGRDDVIKVYAELRKEYPADRIAMVGDSAGAGLILQALLAMKELDMRMPACCCLMSPFLDYTCSSPSIENNAESDPFIIPKFIRGIIPHYITPPYRPDQPGVNPLYSDLSGFPPCLVHVGGIEVLVDESRLFAARARAHGVDCELLEYPKMSHVWHINRQFFMPESQRALQEIGAFMKRHIPQKEPTIDF